MKTEFGKCEQCGTEVKAPDFECITGGNHIVKSKTYYMDDAPSDPGARAPGTFIPLGLPLRDSQTQILNLVPSKKVTRGHEVHEQMGRNVTFKRGIYETSDPEEQFYLELRQGKGLVSYERWSEVYLTPQQKSDMKRASLEAELKRLETERNSLLDQVQAKQKKVPA